MVHYFLSLSLDHTLFLCRVAILFLVFFMSPNIIKNLISIRRFTTNNNCSIEFDPFGLSVKDLHTRNVIARCNSSGDLYPFYPTSTSATAFLPLPFGIIVLGILGVKLCPSLSVPALFLVIRMI